MNSKEESKSEIMKRLMPDYSAENKDYSHQMRIKAVEMCKQGKLNLHQMHIFFPIEMLKVCYGIKKEFTEDEQIMLEVQNTEAATTVPEMLEREIQFERVEACNEARMKKVLRSVAATTVPAGLLLKRSNLEEALAGIFSLKEVKKDIIFGPYIGVGVRDRQDAYDNGYCWDVYKNNKFHHCVDARNPSESNWMKFVNPTDSAEHQNLEAFQRGYQVYFRAMKDIPAGTELLVWYSLQYNQDCHQSIQNLKSKCRKSLEKVILEIEKYNKKWERNEENNLFEKNVNFDKKHFKCIICDKSFTKQRTLLRHHFIHTERKPYKCDTCNKTFTRKYLLKVHKRIHTGEQPYKCALCDKTFTTKYQLNMHTGENLFKCDMCDKSFTHISHLTSHKYIHTGEKPFKCDQCDKAFTQISHLTSHKYIHTGEKPFKCDLCEKTFTQISHLTSHKYIHTGEKPYKCDICDKAFTQISNLTSHKRTHTGEKPFKCDVCYKAFAHKSQLTLHNRIHTGEKPYKCVMCDKAFSQISSLNLHKRHHTGEKPFKCEMCDKAYVQRTQLTSHKHIHTGEKPFNCDTCDKAFTQISHLTLHNHIHTGEKPFKCDTCDKAFALRSYLTSHKCTNERCFSPI